MLKLKIYDLRDQYVLMTGTCIYMRDAVFPYNIDAGMYGMLGCWDVEMKGCWDAEM